MIAILIGLTLNLQATESQPQYKIVNRCFQTYEKESASDVKVGFLPSGVDSKNKTLHFQVIPPEFGVSSSIPVNTLGVKDNYKYLSLENKFKTYIVSTYNSKSPNLGRCTYVDKATGNVNSVTMHGEDILAETHCVNQSTGLIDSKQICLTTHPSLCEQFRKLTTTTFDKTIEYFSTCNDCSIWKDANYAASSGGYPNNEAADIKKQLKVASLKSENIVHIFDPNPKSEKVELNEANKTTLFTFLKKSCDQMKVSKGTKRDAKPGINYNETPTRGSAVGG